MRFDFKMFDRDYFVEWSEGDKGITTDFDSVEELIDMMIENELPVVVDLFGMTETAGLGDKYVAFGTINTALEILPDVTDVRCDDVPESWDEPDLSNLTVESAK